MSHRTSGLLMSLVLFVALAGLCSAAETFSWQQSHAKVDPKGNLAWAPQAFTFEKGQSVRYIDFDGGNDANPGTSPDKAWKHHPWDPQATGQAKAAAGVDTYVFKRGVIYRGNMVARESGKPGDPIRLTSDPSWGAGDAVISGSEVVSGWKKGAQNADIPDPQKVWTARLDYRPAPHMGGRQRRHGHPNPPRPHPELDGDRPRGRDERVVAVGEPAVVGGLQPHDDRQRHADAPGHRHEAPDARPLLLQGCRGLERVGHRDGHSLPHQDRPVLPAEEGDRFRGQVVQRQRPDQHGQPLLPGGQAPVPRLGR